MFTPSPSLFPQTCWIILRGPHQLPLGDHLQVLSLQQSCLRPFCVLFAAAPVQEDVEGHDQQDPQEKLHQLLGAGAARPERPAAQRVRSLVGHTQSEICPTWPTPSSSPQLWAGWSPDHVPPVAQDHPGCSGSSPPSDWKSAIDPWSCRLHKYKSPIDFHQQLHL